MLELTCLVLGLGFIILYVPKALRRWKAGVCGFCFGNASEDKHCYRCPKCGCY